MRNLQKTIVICVDDEKIVLDSLEDQIMARLGKNVDCEMAGGAEEALELIDEYISLGRKISLIISDQQMPGMKGDVFLIEAHKRLPETPKILLTGQSGIDAVRNAINNARLYRYFTKPWQEDDLMLTLEEAIRSFEQQGQLKEFNVYTRLLRSLNKAANEISSEINLNQLVDKFLRIAIDCTDAEKGVLLLKSETGLKIEAMGQAGQTIATRLTDYPSDVLQELTNVMTENILALFEFQEQTNSRQLAARIVHKESEWGYIYLEQFTQGRSFSPYHSEMLEMLSSQAAISIENANLYQQLQAQKENIEKINQIVEQKNEDITDSIKYAQRIQKAISPNFEVLKKFFPHFFLLLRPRDIVSGDFYWWKEQNEHLWLACADCTGHGVPGAIMSILGVNILNEISSHHSNYQPDEVLTQLDEHLRNALQQASPSTQTNDGMDIAFIKYLPLEKKIFYSGANRPMYIMRQGAIIEISPNKLAVGGNKKFRIDSEFITQEIELQQQDILFLFSDGITDQFGGAQGKKFSSKRLKETLIQLHELPLEEYRDLINVMFDDWREDKEQTDDVIIMGLMVQ